MEIYALAPKNLALEGIQRQRPHIQLVATVQVDAQHVRHVALLLLFLPAFDLGLVQAQARLPPQLAHLHVLDVEMVRVVYMAQPNLE